MHDLNAQAQERRTRGQGEGSIYQRASDGMWVSVIDLGWHNGKRSRKYLYGKTRADVAEKLNDALYKQDRGLRVKMERQTLAQFLERWLIDVIAPSRRANTLRAYQIHVHRHIAPAIGHRQLTKLTPQDVQRLISDRLAAGLSPQTVRGILSTLRLALAQAERWDLVERNVVTRVDVPRRQPFEPLPLTPAEARRRQVHLGRDPPVIVSLPARLRRRQGAAPIAGLALQLSIVVADQAAIPSTNRTDRLLHGKRNERGLCGCLLPLYA